MRTVKKIIDWFTVTEPEYQARIKQQEIWPIDQKEPLSFQTKQISLHAVLAYLRERERHAGAKVVQSHDGWIARHPTAAHYYAAIHDELQQKFKEYL